MRPLRPAPRILLAPLNWGLGHATRCLPLAAALEAELGAEVHWASDGRALDLLREELPHAACVHELPGYGIRYPTRHAELNMLLGAPGIARAIRAEGRAVARLHDRYGYDLILSDNRFGCRLTGVRSFVVSHQVHLPLRGVGAWFGQALNAHLLRRFDGLLVPDAAREPRLAGRMSAPLPGVPTTYLGALSRFRASGTSAPGVGPDVLVVLSGVEPQRSILEATLLRQLACERFGDVIFVRGVPGASPPSLAGPIPGGVRVRDLATTQELSAWYRGAGAIVTRPGYTTLMDLAALGRTALYVPTPGQPEQAVLAKAQEERGVGVRQEQRHLDLRAGLGRLSTLTAPPARGTGTELADWLDSLKDVG